MKSNHGDEDVIPTCRQEVAHWIRKYQNNHNDSKAFWKLRCYLNWCEKQDRQDVLIRFKDCCASDSENIEHRLREEGWMSMSKQEVVQRANRYLNN
ncbi:lon2 [Acrasis kona]|uniref:Lon2 n=1 Tax=Acrasis kona TaxID=1008807 RepID=A0AAW2ZIL2_9EUKA